MKKTKRTKEILSIIIVILLIIIVGGAVKNYIIKYFIEKRLTDTLGARVEMEKFVLGISTQIVRVKGLKIYNPQGFKENILLDIPKISINYNLNEILNRKIHLTLLYIDLAKVVLAENSEDQLNIESFSICKNKNEKPKENNVEIIQDKKTKMPFKVDLLVLNIGKIIYEDYSKGDKPSFKTYNINAENRIYTDIESSKELYEILMSETIKHALGRRFIDNTKLYGSAMILGAGFLPAGLARLIISKDSTEKSYQLGFDTAFDLIIETLKTIGKLDFEDRQKGIINANVDGSDVTVKIKVNKDRKTEIKVVISARKLFMPNPQVAEGVLNKISENIDKIDDQN